MIKIFHSLSTENLIDKLLDEMDSAEGASDPFYSSKIIIPNNNLSKYINLYISKKRTVSFNLNFDYLENILTELLLNLADTEKSGIEFLGNKKNHIILTYVINAIIHGDYGIEELSEIRNFIGNAADKEKNKKIWQLSEKLSLLFREYEYKRKFMTDGWLKYQRSYPEINSEVFQMHIYHKIFNRKNGLLLNEINNRRFTTLTDIFNAVGKTVKKTGGAGKEKIHIFCLSNISNFHYVLINYLSNFFDFNLYSLNYSGSYTNENFSSYRIFKVRDENFNQIRQLLNKCIILEDKNIKKIKPESLLEAVKNWLTEDNGKSLFDKINYDKIKNDGTIRIAGCQGIHREVETVANSILHNLLNTPDLKLNEIAVLVPDLNKYKPYFNYIFNRNGKIRFNLIDSTAKDDSNYGKAVISLFSLINGNFTRKEMFELFYNPCFMKKFGLSFNDVNIWLEICEENNIYNNFNEQSIFSWKKGMERISLGKIMERDDESGENFNFNSYFKIIPFSRNNIYDNSLLDKFIVIIQSLKNDISELKNTDMNSLTLIYKIIDIFNEYLEVDHNDKFEASIKNSIVDALHTLVKISNFSKKNDFLNIDFLTEYLESALDSIPSSRGNYLTGGINVSRLLPMRPIPFKIIYIMGLNEKDFPGKNEKSMINLINHEKLPGDLLKSEINLILFIEIIMSVKNRLYLTFINKDIEKDADLYPSPAINILMDFINGEILKDDRIEIIKTPLNSESLEYVNIEKTGKYPDIFCNYSLYQRHCMLKKLEAVNFKLHEGLKKKSDDYLNKFNFIDYGESKKEIPKNIKLNINELSKFIENPIEQLIKKHLDIYDEEFEDASEKEDEIFFSGKLFSYDLYNNIISNSIKDIKKLKDNFNNYYEYQTLTGNAPENQFGTGERIKLFDQISSIFENGKFIEFMKKIRSYENFIQPDLERRKFPFITVNINEIAGYDIELSGSYDCFFKKDDNYELLHITNSGEIKNKYLIKPFLYYLMLLYENKKIGEFNLNIIMSKEDNYFSSFKFDGCDRAFASGYLTELIKDYLFNRESLHYMPVDMIDEKLAGIEDPDLFRTEYAGKIIDAESNEYKQTKKSDALKLITDINSYIPVNCHDIFKKRIYPILKNKITGGADNTNE